MIMQAALSVLLAGIVLYAWVERRRSPVVGLLSMLSAIVGIYLVWTPAHASALDIWETEYLQALDGEDAVFNWVSGTALVPYREALGEDDRKEFLNAYRERLSRAYPRGANGKTLFPFKRIFIVAQR